MADRIGAKYQRLRQLVCLTGHYLMGDIFEYEHHSGAISKVQVIRIRYTIAYRLLLVFLSIFILLWASLTAFAVLCVIFLNHTRF